MFGCYNRNDLKRFAHIYLGSRNALRGFAAEIFLIYRTLHIDCSEPIGIFRDNDLDAICSPPAGCFLDPSKLGWRRSGERGRSGSGEVKAV